MFLCFRPILFLTFFNSLICVGSLIEKFYIQTVPGTKHHRFLVSLIFLLQLSFFRHNKRLRKVEHLQRKETISSEPYFRCKEMSTLRAGYIPQHKLTSASSSGSLGFIMCVKCCRMVDSVPRWGLSLSSPIQSDHLLIAVCDDTAFGAETLLSTFLGSRS